MNYLSRYVLAYSQLKSWQIIKINYPAAIYYNIIFSSLEARIPV